MIDLHPASEDLFHPFSNVTAQDGPMADAMSN